MRNHRKELKEYNPNSHVPNIDKEMIQLSKNYWTVINCPVEQLEGTLKKLPNGRKQLAIARYEDQATVVVNELDVLF